MKTYALVVEVPSIAESEGAYNPDRPISSLLLHQVRHLHSAEQHLPERDRTGINVSQLHTELDASTYIATVTALLRAKGAKKTETKRPRKKSAARKTKLKSATKKATRTGKKRK